MDQYQTRSLLEIWQIQKLSTGKIGARGNNQVFVPAFLQNIPKIFDSVPVEEGIALDRFQKNGAQLIQSFLCELISIRRGLLGCIIEVHCLAK